MAPARHQEDVGRNGEHFASSIAAYESDTDYSCISIDSDDFDFPVVEAPSSIEAQNGAGVTASIDAQRVLPPADEQVQLLQTAGNGVQPHANQGDSSARGEEGVDNAEPELCQEQRELIDLIASGRNVFFTGSAGCGKSTVLKAAVRKLQEMGKELGKEVHVVAPTGRAALEVDGMTAFNYMGWNVDTLKDPIEKLRTWARGRTRKNTRHRLQRTEVLIIDEISMMENHHLQRMNICMKQIKQGGHPAPAPFGGVQVIVTGDFCQLPPVKPFQHCIECGKEMKQDDFETEYNCPKNHGPFKECDKWAFRSRVWEECNFIYVELKQIHRQNDEKFLKMLQKCRLGIPLSMDETITLMDPRRHVTDATRLFPTTKEVSRVNKMELEKLKTKEFTYQALDGFNLNYHKELDDLWKHFKDGTLEALEDHRLERQAQLRIGMRVVLQVNLDHRAKLCNGSQGTIFDFEKYDHAKLPRAWSGRTGFSGLHAEGPTIYGENAALREQQVKSFISRQKDKVWPRVRFHNGLERTIYAECMVTSFGHYKPYALLYRTQIPLVAGWAMTIHRSQGMTLDRVIVDLSKAFEEAQVYVALSRVRSLAGLKINGSSGGLSVGHGGNADVIRFLREKSIASDLPPLEPYDHLSS
ncbi:PIF1-like helicase [Metarhizium robertsii]|uniref:ATP-dependent DNA helicase n=2 Tax=Metarhizium robertsii TaxID=568076 RepID=E9EME3_METRA|nr:aaa ATPase [Metarhizium robertsii ARSEF 23]EFZ03251.1 aaa ATPase [Metarhizium robertsii ARSEF 23]EXV01067.1 PIF1-like helicase [Metarhizium robertsii]